MGKGTRTGGDSGHSFLMAPGIRGVQRVWLRKKPFALPMDSGGNGRAFSRREDFLKAVRRFEKRLPSLLGFLRRPEKKAREAALVFPADPRAFRLLYHQTARRRTSEAYRFAEKKLFSFFGQRIFEARDTLSSLLRSVFRAGSLIENVNGRLRPFMDLKREVPESLFTLPEVFFNTKKDRRPRNRDWTGTGAIDRLTGQSCPEFLDLLFGQRNYAVYMD